MENIKFNDLKLDDKVLKTIDDMGFEEPSKYKRKLYQ